MKNSIKPVQRRDGMTASIAFAAVASLLLLLSYSEILPLMAWLTSHPARWVTFALGCGFVMLAWLPLFSGRFRQHWYDAWAAANASLGIAASTIFALAVLRLV